MKIKFGCAGNPLNFFKSEFAGDRFGILEWSAKLGLNAQERQMTHGARMKEEDAVKFGEMARKFRISLSVHGPYYVVLSSLKTEVERKSVAELIKTCRLAKLMGAGRVVVHPGFYTGRSSEVVLNQVVGNIRKVEEDKEDGVVICVELMGKPSQFGSLDEIISICQKTDCEPCIDWGHLYARTIGKVNGKSDFRRVLERLEKELGRDVLKGLHCHFAPMEFGEKGEKKHRAVMEEEAEPKFAPLGELIKEFKIYPTLISESYNSQDIGALEMKRKMVQLNFGV